jgi:predicted nucleic acid-binding protein
MIAVSDASPLCYLVLIGEIHLLPRVFSQVVAPEAVMRELLHEDAPRAVRDWASDPPAWLRREAPPDVISPGMEKLQAGERAAIILAESMAADIIVLDEKAARRIAEKRGLSVTGTLGVLGEAAARGLVDLASAIDRLRRTSFRYSPALLKATLDRFGTGPAKPA